IIRRELREGTILVSDMTDKNLYSPEPNRKDKSNAQVQGQKGIRGVSSEEVRQYGYRTNPATRGDDFKEGIQRVYEEHPVGKAVEVKSLDFYKDPKTGLFLSEDSLAGMAVTPDADLVSVFKHPDSDANVKEMLGEASEYAKTLDAYDVNGFLPNLYSQFGFKPVARVKFNREFAPDGWPYDKLGEPDIVLMVKDPDDNIAPVKMDVQGFDKVREQVPVMDGMDAWDYAAQFSEKAKSKSLDEGDLSMPVEQMFMPLSKDELPEPFTRTEGPMGMDILYNDGVIMVGPQSQGEAPARAGFDGRVDRGRFVIYDRNEYNLAVTENRNPDPAGYVVATTTQDGKFDALIDIKLDKNVRSKGLGTKVVHSMLHDGLNGEIHVKDIMSSAKKFWKKIGVEDFKPFKDSGYKTRTEGVMRLKRGPIKLRGFRDENSYMPALEDAKALVQKQGRVAEAAEDAFFGKMFPKMLRKVGGGLKPSTRNIREAARRAIEDTEVFLKENPQFADYYKADMAKVRALLDDAYNGIIDDEMLYYRLTLGLTSPGTSLPANVGDGLNIFNLKRQDGNLDKIKLGESEKGNVVVAESPFQISGLTAPTKAKALKIVDRLEKEKGGIRQAVEFLEEGIPLNELHKFKQEMGFKGKVGKVGDVRRIVKSATGQDKLIPRMFIFGPKVGAYTLNAIGRHNFNTIDVWEARFIRSYFKGMFSKNTGLPANVDEHALMTRFTEMFQEEYNRMTGQNLETSALQALRWFYMIDTAKKLGYTGASTNETISGYTERYLTRLGLDQGSGGQSNATTDGGVSAQAGPTEQQFLPQPRQLNRVTSRPARTQPTNRFMMMPAAARAAVASGQTLDRFRN
ncbi:hypothetical protein OAG36_01000, partial [bacterium]|nr:hypothetical protein [bacterium]